MFKIGGATGLCVFGSLLALACSGVDAGSDGSSIEAAQAPSELVNAKGTKLKLVGKAKTLVASAKDVGLQGSDTATATPSNDENQLAEDLRGLTLSDGYEYREAAPSLALARKVIAARKLANTGSVGNLGSQPADDSAGEREGRAVFGADGRVYKSNNTSFPYRTFTFSEVGCTGTIIGPGTMVTAAHCVYDTVSNAWLQVWDPTFPNGSGGVGANRWPRWAPGVDGRDATGAPYGWQQCYDVTIPGAYVSETSQTSANARLYDYAVLDFTTRCGVRPGDSTGWMGTWIYSEASIESLTVNIYGYPSTAAGASRYHGSVPNKFGEIWGMSGSVYIDSPTTKLKTTIDTSGGQSGASYWVNDTDWRVIGIHHGAEGTYNSARRFDADVFNFFDANSPYPQQL